MSQVAKLKKQAAEFEAKKQFDKAIGVYAKLLDAFDSHAEELDVGLFNRVGDLLLRQGNVADAVDYYEKGIDRYSETGFFNNAIALCNKVLRHSPGRTSIYYKLGRISAKKGFTNEARTNFLEYADRMQKAGKTDEAFRALTEFADLCPDQDEIRLTLADQLTRAGRKDDAIEQLQTLHERLDGEGRESDARAVVDRMRAIDPAVEPRKSTARGKKASSELVFIDLDEPTSFSPSIPEGIPLVPPTQPSKLVETAPPVATPAIGIKSITPPDSALLLTSAADSLAYSIEEPSADPLLGFEPTVIDEPLATPSAAVFDVSSTFDPTLDEAYEQSATDAETPSADAPAETPEPADFGTISPQASLPDAEPLASLAREPLAEPLDDLLGDVPRAPTPAWASPTTSFPSPVSPSAPSVPAMPPSGDDAFEIPGAVPLDDAPLATPAAPASAGSIDIEFGSARDSGESLVADEPDIPEISAGGTPASSPRAAPTPARTGPIPSLPAGILLADALEATRDSRDGGAPLADPLEPEAMEFPTPAQTRRSTAVAVESVEALTASVEAAPENWVLHRDLGEAMLDAGDRAGGIRELEFAMAGAERSGNLDLASAIAEEVARIEPESVKHQQKRVEYAFRTNDRARLIEAYLGLASVLLRAEQNEKARTIYQRVLDLAPDEPRARLALGSITPVRSPSASRGFTPISGTPVSVAARPRRASGTVPPARPPSGSYINLGDLLREDDVPRDTRMVVPEEAPTGDEAADFADMLRKFKAGIARNVAPEDHQSHYDLAIAYKEMGLVDEAIAEFQKALAGPTNRLPTYESLGQCFLEKEQYRLASSILSRALSEQASDDQLVGILYLLGRAAEFQGRAEEALGYYQRVFVVDIQFRDIVDRMSEVERTLR